MFIGAVATMAGGFGLAFRAAGIGYVPQCVAALLLGITTLIAGLSLARTERRRWFATPARHTNRPIPVTVKDATGRTYAFGSNWNPEGWPSQPTRVRVQAWTTVDRVLAAPLRPDPH